MRYRRSWMLICLLLFSLFPPLEFKRGGISMGTRGRGSSASRTGLFGGGGKPSRTSSGANAYHRNLGNQQRSQNIGHGFNSGGGWNSGLGKQHKDGYNSGSSWSGKSHSSPKSGLGGLLGGLTGRNRGHHSGGHRFTASGIGSRSRSNTFKNMIVGAAAGYLTYQAGKAIIRSMAGPMMWNNRPYYWGQNYYRPRPTDSNMCRMPIDETDPQFGNIYSTDGMTRPREIVWGCGYHEYCCGYECCRGGSAQSYGGGISLGSIMMLLFVLFCCLPCLIKVCMGPCREFCRREGGMPELKTLFK